MQIINKIICALGLLLVMSPAIAGASPIHSTSFNTFAAGASYCGNGDNTAKGQILQGAGTSGSDCNGINAQKAIATVISILGIIVGVAAVIMVIFSGFKYITAAGDSGKIASAKSTLIYAIVGLLIAALAQLLVQFALNVTITCKYDSSLSASDSSCVAPIVNKK